MTTVTRNLIGNFVGRGVAAGLSILLIPVYIHFLGVEAYGLVGFFIMLQTLFGVLDFGLSTTTQREIAIRVADDAGKSDARDLLRTVESFYWPFGLVIGAVILALAPLLARRWLHPDTLPVSVIQTAIMLMGIATALQWPYKLYEGVFHGLQRIVAFNAITAGMQTVRGLGAVLVVWLWPTITAFFVWQVAVSAVTVVLLCFGAWHLMPDGPRPMIRLSLVRDSWRFAAGMTITVAMGVILSHSDRIILSSMLPLKTFGYYSVAVTAASGLLYLMAPISLTVLPRFTELLARKRHEVLVRTYHLSAQLMTVVLTPIALVLALFAREVITIWTRSALIAERTRSVAAILVMAMLMQALLEVPYMMQLAQGRARLAVYTSLVSVAIYVPLLIILVRRYGLIGGALPILIVYAAKFIIWGPLVHSVVLPGEKRRWFIDDVARPVLAAAAVTITARLLLPPELFASFLPSVSLLGIVVVAAAVAAILAAPLARSRTLSLLALLRDALAVRKDNSQTTRIDP